MFGRRGVGGTNFQLLMLSSNLLKSKIPMSGEGGGRGVGETNFQLLMLSPNLLKSKIPMSGWWNQFPTFDAESKFAKKFSGKNWNGFVLDFEYRVVRYTKYSEPQ